MAFAWEIIQGIKRFWKRTLTYNKTAEKLTSQIIQKILVFDLPKRLSSKSCTWSILEYFIPFFEIKVSHLNTFFLFLVVFFFVFFLKQVWLKSKVLDIMKRVACRFTFKWNQFNPLQPGVAYLYSLKTSENL